MKINTFVSASIYYIIASLIERKEEIDEPNEQSIYFCVTHGINWPLRSLEKKVCAFVGLPLIKCVRLLWDGKGHLVVLSTTLRYNRGKMVKDESMANDVPQHFDRAFLRWFQERTEETWQKYQTRTLENYVTSRVVGDDWQPGTRWLNGLKEQEIVAIEGHYQLHFPPDYRLFLQMLHSVDRPMVGVRFIENNTKVLGTSPSFYNWQTDTTSIQSAYEWLVYGLVFDVRQNNLWLPGWGAKPGTLEAQEARVRDLVNTAPKLIPVFGHRYLLAEPCEAGNPVFSIYQSDMIIYCEDLHSYFLHEFGDLVGAGRPAHDHQGKIRLEPYRAIPFWGEILWGEF